MRRCLGLFVHMCCVLCLCSGCAHGECAPCCTCTWGGGGGIFCACLWSGVCTDPGTSLTPFQAADLSAKPAPANLKVSAALCEPLPMCTVAGGGCCLSDGANLCPCKVWFLCSVWRRAAVLLRVSTWWHSAPPRLAVGGAAVKSKLRYRLVCTGEPPLKEYAHVGTWPGLAWISSV